MLSLEDGDSHITVIVVISLRAFLSISLLNSLENNLITVVGLTRTRHNQTAARWILMRNTLAFQFIL